MTTTLLSQRSLSPANLTWLQLNLTPLIKKNTKKKFTFEVKESGIRHELIALEYLSNGGMDHNSNYSHTIPKLRSPGLHNS